MASFPGVIGIPSKWPFNAVNAATPTLDTLHSCERLKEGGRENSAEENAQSTILNFAKS